jgi:hypothetical protein
MHSLLFSKPVILIIEFYFLFYDKVIISMDQSSATAFNLETIK